MASELADDVIRLLIHAAFGGLLVRHRMGTGAACVDICGDRQA